MLLYACASCILGWSGMSCLAQNALAARGLANTRHLTYRALIALICAIGAVCAWVLIEDTICCLAFTFACACMAALLACDLREHVLPTELVALLLVLSIVFRTALGGAAGVIESALPVALFSASLLVLNHLRTQRGAYEFIGSGDARMFVPLAIFAGTQGLFAGIMACALVMGIIATVQMACGRLSRTSSIALAPGLAAWLFVGTLLPLV